MASDNLTAAAAGALGSVNDLLSEYVRASIGNKFKKDYMASEKELQNKYEMEQLPVKKQYEFDILGKKAELERGQTDYEYGQKSAYEAESVPLVDQFTGKKLNDVARGSLFANTRPNASFANREFKTSSDLRKEFNNRPEVKDYTVVSTQVKSMDSLLNELKSGNKRNLVALDQGLVTMYNKLTDPQSVVRESEYARTPANLPMVNRIEGALDKVKEGGAGMTDEDREALVLGAKIIMKERGGTFNETRKQYSSLAQEYNIDPKLVTGIYGEYSTPTVAPESNVQTNQSVMTPDKITRLQELRAKKQAGTLGK